MPRSRRSIKVKLVFETEVEVCDTQYDFLSLAVHNMKTRLDKADSMDDLADVFSEMRVNGSTKHPGYKT